MADEQKLRNPWLLAVWPGMGNVAAGAGGYLVSKLEAKFVHEMPTRDFFEIQHIEIKDGLARKGSLPHSLFFEWRNPDMPFDLLIFLGEAQPSQNGYAFCHRLLDYAMQRDVKRVYTFAAMATQLHPSNTPRVFSVATENDELLEVKDKGAEVMRDGQISGLNGVMLAACAERNLPAICLMGELPFFAAGVPNPKASLVVLEVFTKLAGITLDFKEIQGQADTVEKGLLQLLEKMKESTRQQSENEGNPLLDLVKEDENGDDEDQGASDPDADTRRRIESLFELAHRDRDKAFRLKEELDRLGIFEQYEDRFLDLFRKAE